MKQTESQRLSSLRQYNILDTDYDPVFDQLTDLASTAFDAPIALISLVDENRQWFKSHKGLKDRETSRKLSFCAHAILGESVFHIKDATKDDRFKTNDLVTGEPGIRTYLGAPLIVDEKHMLGTICVIYTEVTEIPRERFRTLSKLADLTTELIKDRKK